MRITVIVLEKLCLTEVSKFSGNERERINSCEKNNVNYRQATVDFNISQMNRKAISPQARDRGLTSDFPIMIIKKNQKVELIKILAKFRGQNQKKLVIRGLEKRFRNQAQICKLPSPVKLQDRRLIENSKDK